jgi:hypothetical protein
MNLNYIELTLSHGANTVTAMMIHPDPKQSQTFRHSTIVPKTNLRKTKVKTVMDESMNRRRVWLVVSSMGAMSHTSKRALIVLMVNGGQLVWKHRGTDVMHLLWQGSPEMKKKDVGPLHCLVAMKMMSMKGMASHTLVVVEET